MKVTYSLRAILDLREIGGYLLERNPAVARAVERRIHALVQLVARFPASGRKLEQRPEVRVIPLGRYPYRVFYTVGDVELVILHVRHRAREAVDPRDL